MCINILADSQQEICVKFSRSGAGKFADVDWSPAGNGAPRLHGALATIEADLLFEHGAGDHTIVVGT